MPAIFKYSLFLAQLAFGPFAASQNNTCLVKGKVTTEAGKVIELVAIKLNQFTVCFTDKYGEFQFKTTKNNSYSLSTHHLSYESYVTQLKPGSKDTLVISIKLKDRLNYLDPIEVTAINKPETLVGK